MVVDVQRDFCPGGALAIRDGDKVVPKLNKVIKSFIRAGLPVFFTRDWHPPDHVSFKSQGGVWPPHCVEGTRGAEFHPKLRVPKGAVVISKGTEPKLEAYSGFQGTDLDKRLKDFGVGEIMIGGLTTDYCVKQSSLDALGAGFKVKVLEDCIKGVNLHENDSKLALTEIVSKGAELVSSSEAARVAARGAIHSEETEA